MISSYEEIPYESSPIHTAGPDVLAVSAVLLGRDAPAPDDCRVLELGCSTGGNLMSLAVMYPNSRFVGIDLAPGQIAVAQGIVDKLGLSNIEFTARSILDLDDSLGQFDYVICHGVFSWVPPDVQEMILQIFHDHLRPRGIGYISYNTYPGWHFRGMVRQMLSWHLRHEPDARQRIARARTFIQYMAEALKGSSNPYAGLLADESALLRDAPDSYVYHEHLEDVNQPVYFHELATRAAEHGLEFLCESRLTTQSAEATSPRIRKAIEDLAGDAVERQQYMDYLQNRTFRRSLFVHAGTLPPPGMVADVVPHMFIESNCKPDEARTDLGEGEEAFITRDGLSRTTNSQALRAALRLLYEAYPSPLSYAELRRRLVSQPAMAAMGKELDQTLAPALLQSHLVNLVELMLCRPAFVTEISDRPAASPLARLQAAEGFTQLSSLRHRAAPVEEFARAVLPYLDGQRNHEQIVEALMGDVRAGKIEIESKDQSAVNDERIRSMLADALPKVLREVAGRGLLKA